MARRVVDVQQDGVEATARLFRVQPAGVGGQCEEVAVHQAAAGVRGQPGSEGYQVPLVPVDDFGECVDHGQRVHPGVVQGGLGGVAESESADGYVQFGVRQFGQSEFRERDLMRR